MSPDVRAQVRVSLEGAAEAAEGGPRGRPEDRHPFRAGVGARVASLRCPILLSSSSIVRRLPISPNKNHPLWKKTAINPGGFGGQSPSRNCHQKCGAFRPDSAGDSRRYKKQIAASPTHVCAFKCLPRKEMFRMLHTYTADAPRISIGTKG